jgi:hypothetical protein
MNCLAELTVVPKLDHGVLQWPYIIAGVLFAACRQVSFFLLGKQKKEHKTIYAFVGVCANGPLFPEVKKIGRPTYRIILKGLQPEEVFWNLTRGINNHTA